MDTADQSTTGKVIRFIFGGIFGFIIGLGAWASGMLPESTSFALIALVFVFVFGLLGIFGGERVWRTIGDLWWWT